jgi:hypothetical protein
MTRYAVFENGKPCTTETLNASGKTHFTSAHGWDNNEFDTLEQAQEYIERWMSPIGIIKLTPNVPWDYGYGIMIEIQTIT